jgi:2,4-dienoyl-CoA reductase-like NADH-dependent reductase (Old Yellow Enzyme family)
MISFQPLSLKKFQTINRFVRSATCEYLADNQGRPGQDFLELYKKLAKGNIGIIITGFAYVMPNGKSTPGQAGIYSDDLIPSWKEITKILKDSGSIFLMQIVHGGHQENRTRIVVEIIKGIKKIVNEKFIISAKLNGEDFIEGGLTLKQAIESAKFLKEAGLDFIEISGGTAESRLEPVRKDIANIDQEGYLRDHAKVIRKEVGIPTASVGGYRTLEVIEQTLRSGEADLISLCRPFIREPDLLLKFKANEMDKASCISCNKCFNPKGLSCPHGGIDSP